MLVYAVFRATDFYREHGQCGTDTAVDSLAQHCKNAVRGHKSAEVIDLRWRPMLSVSLRGRRR